MKKSIVAAINEQINSELYSAYLYLAMSSYCDSINRKGFAHWMMVQFQEEQGHALKLIKFVQDCRGAVVLKAITAPPPEFKGLEQVFELTLKHEESVTKSIHELYALTIKEKDYPTQIELQWFVTEQVEEERNATEILDLLKLAGNAPQALFALDRQVGMRAGK